MEHFDKIAEQRRRIADTLEGLSPAQWASPSLCGDWTVQQVAGHLTAGWNVGLGMFALGILRARGSFNAANARFGCELGAREPQTIIDDLRAHADHRFTPPGAGSEAPLTDVLVHAQDMFIPVGVAYEADPAVVVRVLPLAADKKSRRIRGTDIEERFALRTTDVVWRHENPGRPELAGPAIAMLLTLCGRTAGHAQLDGPVETI